MPAQTPGEFARLGAAHPRWWRRRADDPWGPIDKGIADWGFDAPAFGDVAQHTGLSV